MKNFCGKCGTKLENGICPTCREVAIEQRKKNNKSTYIVLLVLSVIFFAIVILGILIALLIPDDFKTKKSKENCEYTNVFSYSNEQIYYYCLDEVEVYKNRKEKYVDLKKYYEDNKDATRKIIKELDEKNKYEDGSIMYEYYRNLSLLKCANDGILIFGPEDMKFEDGFCGLDKAPEKVKKENNSKSKSKQKNTKKKSKSYKNLKTIKNDKLKNNFVSACNEIKMNPDKIKNLSKKDDWANGPRYSFDYEGESFLLYAYDNGEISSINILNSDMDKVYLEQYESFNVNDFLINTTTESNIIYYLESYLSTLVKHPDTAKFNWISNPSLRRYKNMYAASGSFTSKNDFNLDMNISYYVEFTIEDGTISTKYTIINNKKVFGNTSIFDGIKREKKPEKIDDSSDGSFELIDGQLGKYGKEDLYDGEKYIRYYVPSGKYIVEAVTKNAHFYVEKKKIYKEDGFDTSKIVKNIIIEKVGDKVEIEVKYDECISLVVHTKIKLNKN